MWHTLVQFLLKYFTVTYFSLVTKIILNTHIAHMLMSDEPFQSNSN